MSCKNYPNLNKVKIVVVYLIASHPFLPTPNPLHYFPRSNLTFSHTKSQILLVTCRWLAIDVDYHCHFLVQYFIKQFLEKLISILLFLPGRNCLPFKYTFIHSKKKKKKKKRTILFFEPYSFFIVLGSQCEPRTFPRHQPELDPPNFKYHYNKFESTSMAAYKDPRK